MSRWAVLVVRLLQQKPWRFTEIRRALDGISQKMLTQTLRGLERDGVVRRMFHEYYLPAA